MSEATATPEPAADLRYRTFAAVAWIAALFSLLIGATLLYEHATATANDPWKSPQLLALKTKMAASPKDEQIKTQIRELDLVFRQRYFRRLAMDATGGWMLAGGIAVFLFAASQAAGVRKSLPVPQPNPEAARDAARAATMARRSVAVMGGLALTAVAAAGLCIRQAAPVDPAGSNPPGAAVVAAVPSPSDLPTLAEFQNNWPRFRGPDGSGFSKLANVPLAWDGAQGAGILWKSAVPAPGFNSPLVWKDRVFISGGTAEKREVLCYDAADGKLLWERVIEPLPGSPKVPEISETTGYAAPTMATDGRRVYAIFATGDLAAVNFDGALAWSKNLGTPKNQYGHATSLAIWGGKLIVQFDQGESAPANSKLLAFDGASGRVLWEKPRPVASSWASPIVIEAAGKAQIITLGVPWVTSYSPEDGSELWRAELMEGEITPSPIFAGGLVCVICPSSKMIAIRPDGSGDVTTTHVAWTSDESLPDVTSPTTNGELIFYTNGGGLLTCLDAKDGKKQWEHDLSMEVQASPGIAGNRVYVLGASGATVVLEADRQFKEAGRGTIDDQFYASPAFAGGRIYLRGNKNLYCIGAGSAPGTPK